VESVAGMAWNQWPEWRGIRTLAEKGKIS